MMMRAHATSEENKVNGWGVPPVGFVRRAEAEPFNAGHLIAEEAMWV